MKLESPNDTEEHSFPDQFLFFLEQSAANIVKKMVTLSLDIDHVKWSFHFIE